MTTKGAVAAQKRREERAVEETKQVKIGRRINQRGWINQRGRVIISYVVLLFHQVALFATSSKYFFIPLLFRLSAQNRAALYFSTS
jgi:hypothetical protein